MKLEIKTSFFIERTLVFVFLLYLEWYKEIWGDNPLILYGSVGLLTGLVAIRLMQQRYLHIHTMPAILKMYFIYFVYSFIGIFVARNASVMVSSLVTFISFVIVCFDCWYISFLINDHNWIYKILKCIAIICALQVILCGQPYYNGIMVTTMSSINNPNALALILLIGMLSFVIDFNVDTLIDFITTLLANVLLLYGIILTGSRKCFLAAIPVIVYWLWFYIKVTRKEGNIKRLLFLIAVMVLGLSVCFSFYSKYFQSMSIFERLSTLFTGTETRRKLLYADSLTFFLASPIIGIGFNQYRFWSPYSTYSHSSYAEVFSCGGIIGTLIFFVPLLTCLFRYIKLAFQKKPFDEMYRIRMVALLFACELFIGVGQIFIYEMLHLLVLMLISMEEKQFIFESERKQIEQSLPN